MRGRKRTERERGWKRRKGKGEWMEQKAEKGGEGERGDKGRKVSKFNVTRMDNNTYLK